MTEQLTANHLSHPEFFGRIGLARTNITPPEGIYARLWGSATHDVATGVHRPMFASCLVLASDDLREELVLLTLDLVALWQEEADRIRQAVLDRFGLQPRQLMLHPSHTHSSPMLARRHADRPGGHLIAPYLDSLPGICRDLVTEARANVFPGVLTWSYGTCALAFNRDAVDARSNRGVCGLNPGRPADDTLLVCRITEPAGRIRGVIVNYACHPVSLGGANKLLSPDYVGGMRELVERETGGICIFLHGASGDLTPRRSYEATVDAAEQNGRELGFAALAALSGMLPPLRRLEYRGIEESGTALGVWSSADKEERPEKLSSEMIEIRLPLKDYPAADVIRAQMGTCKRKFELERLERMLAIKERLGSATEGPFPVTVWRAGDSFLVATTGEPYSEFQMSLRGAFPDKAVAVLNLTNGTTNYLPEASAYSMDNYPARVTEFASGCLEQVIARATTIMRGLA